jgi:hypothetical protein
MDIEPVQPAGSTSWARVVRRRSGDDDERGGRHGAHEDESEPEDTVHEDDEGQPHIDIRV